MGKMKIGIYCYFIADILTKVFRNAFWVVLYQIYTFSPKLLSLIGCHGNEKAEFATKKNKK